MADLDPSLSFAPENPLAQLPGETLRANTALRDYYRLGPGRSLAKLLAIYRGDSAGEPGVEKPPSRRLATLEGWSSKFSWLARVAAQTELDDAYEAIKWEERRRAVREADWKQGNALRDLAERIIAEAPTFIKTRRRVVNLGSPRILGPGGEVLSPGAPEREVVTMALDANLLIRAVQAGSQLMRLSTGEPTERKALDLSGEVSTAAVDLTNLEDDQLRTALQRLSLLGLALSSGESVPGDKGRADEVYPISEDPGPADS